MIPQGHTSGDHPICMSLQVSQFSIAFKQLINKTTSLFQSFINYLSSKAACGLYVYYLWFIIIMDTSLLHKSTVLSALLLLAPCICSGCGYNR